MAPTHHQQQQQQQQRSNASDTSGNSNSPTSSAEPYEPRRIISLSTGYGTSVSVNPATPRVSSFTSRSINRRGPSNTAPSSSNVNYTYRPSNGRESRVGHTQVDSRIQPSLLQPQSSQGISVTPTASQPPSQRTSSVAQISTANPSRISSIVRGTQNMTLTQAFLSMRQFIADNAAASGRSVRLPLGESTMNIDEDSDDDEDEFDLEDDCSETMEDTMRRSRPQVQRFRRFFENEGHGHEHMTEVYLQR